LFLLMLPFLALAQPAKLEVHFKLTDVDYHPVTGVPVRLVLGTRQDWQEPGSGNRFVTDPNGEAVFTTAATVDKRWRGQNVGFTGLSIPYRADHLAIAAELEPAGAEGKYTWLYTMNVYCKGGDCSTDDIEDVYSKDSQGRFTRKAERVNGDWKMPELRGLVLTGAGYQSWNSLLTFDDSRKVWKLTLAFKRSPPPVRR
jgi:hypothetical protein